MKRILAMFVFMIGVFLLCRPADAQCVNGVCIQRNVNNVGVQQFVQNNQLLTVNRFGQVIRRQQLGLNSNNLFLGNNQFALGDNRSLAARLLLQNRLTRIGF